MTRHLCLITGASSGIGAAFAGVYAKAGYDLCLTARRTDRLERLATELRMQYGIDVFPVTADLSETGSVDKIFETLAEEGREVDALINNAGYGIAQAYAKTEWGVQQAFLTVLVTRVAELSHRVLPSMLNKGFGRIINVGSIMGLIPGLAGYSLYGAAKGFVIKFSQSLHLETAGTGVHVCALCPGLTYTEFFESSGTNNLVKPLPRWLWLGADEVARLGYEAVEANRSVCITGASTYAIMALTKIMPDDWILALTKRYSPRFSQ